LDESAVLFGYSTDVDPSFILSWQVFFAPAPVAPALLDKVRADHIDFIIVDYRLDSVKPTQLPYFSVYERLLARYPLPKYMLDKFASAPWLSLAYRSGPVAVFRVNAKAL
jgi:hypothetical protein